MSVISLMTGRVRLIAATTLPLMSRTGAAMLAIPVSKLPIWVTVVAPLSLRHELPLCPMPIVSKCNSSSTCLLSGFTDRERHRRDASDLNWELVTSGQRDSYPVRMSS